MQRLTPLIGGGKQATQDSLLKQVRHVDVEAPTTTRFINVFTVEHVAYGQLLRGLEFLDADNKLIARSGRTDEDTRLTRFEVRENEKLVGFNSYQLSNFDGCHFDV